MVIVWDPFRFRSVQSGFIRLDLDTRSGTGVDEIDNQPHQITSIPVLQVANAAVIAKLNDGVCVKL